MRRLAVVAQLALFVAALVLGAAHDDDHRLHASDGCAVCRHVRATPVAVGDVVSLAPLWFRWPAPAQAPSPARRAWAQRPRARGPPVV